MHPLIAGPLIVALVSSLLALLIAIIDRIVNDYGEVVIDINQGKKVLKVKGGSPLLGTLAFQDIFVPSACGGRGSCGACKVRVLSDVGPHLPTELPYLTPEEVARNVRLSCQIKLKKDIAARVLMCLNSVETPDANFAGSNPALAAKTTRSTCYGLNADSTLSGYVSTSQHGYTNLGWDLSTE